MGRIVCLENNCAYNLDFLLETFQCCLFLVENTVKITDNSIKHCRTLQVKLLTNSQLLICKSKNCFAQMTEKLWDNESKRPISLNKSKYSTLVNICTRRWLGNVLWSASWDQKTPSRSHLKKKMLCYCLNSRSKLNISDIKKSFHLFFFYLNLEFHIIFEQVKTFIFLKFFGIWSQR